MNRDDYERVRKILFEQWDPIDVNTNNNLQDGSLPAFPMSNMLANVERQLGVTPPFTRRSSAAHALIGLATPRGDDTQVS